ncbi:MAG TPA: flagellar assembly protein FliH [Steroidobacteraceae bacterium]|nr:flagellar assembly protein FliH [Steroidobacteraceae bacterium]
MNVHTASPEAASAILADARAWTAPLITDGVPTAGRAGRRSEAQREEERRLFAEAEAAGRAAGLAAAQKEIAARTAALEERSRACTAMLEALSRPLAQLDDQVHEQIARLAVRIARAVVRRELRTDPDQIIGIVRAMVALLPASTQGLRVVVNPEDAALLRERLPAAGPEAAWSLIEDPTLARGDCRVHTDYARLDARVETRLNEALTALVGEERARPRDGEIS